MPLTRLGHHDDWPTLGWDAIDWIEAYLCHGPGDVEGDPLVLDDEWCTIILDCYRLYPRNHPRAGKRVVSRGSIWRAKGRAKSELAGAITCLEGAGGPVRFDGWDAAGKPVGKPVRSPFIRCLATEEGQAGNTYDNVTVMLDYAHEHNPDVFAGVDIGKNTKASTRVFVQGGEIRPSTASSSAKDGGKETFAVADEIHLYYKPELRGMHAMVRRNLRKRKIAEPWLMETTTPFLPGQGSIAQDVWDAVRLAVDKGKKPPGGLYFNYREGSEVTDWNDDDQLLASLTEAYGDAAEWMDLERILSDDIRSPEATEADGRRYWLALVTPGSGRYFDHPRWLDLAPGDITVPNQSLITIGFDGARWFDSTAIVATDVATGYQWVAGLWERPAELGPSDEWEVPEHEVTAVMADLFTRFQVWRAYCDPPHWKDTIAGWAGKWGEKVVIEWWTNRDRAMAFALQNYRTAQATGDLSHDGDEGMSRHIANCFNRETRVKDDDGKPMWTVQKERPKSPMKIDAAIAGCLSWEARSDAIAAGAKKKTASVPRRIR